MELFNIEAEEAVVGAVLYNADAYLDAADIVNPVDFKEERYNWLWVAYKSLHSKNIPIDMITVGNELNSKFEAFGGQAALTGLMARAAGVDTFNIKNHAEVVKACAIRRHVRNAANELLNISEHSEDSELINDTVASVEKVVNRSERTEISTFKDIVSSSYDEIAENSRKSDEELVNVSTGHKDLDKLLIGYQRSDLIVVAGRPGTGKSAFLMDEVRTAGIDAKKNVAVFSAEMSKKQLVNRLISQMTGIEGQRLRTGRLRDDEWPKFTHAIGEIENSNIFIDDTGGITPLQMRTKCKRLHMLYGLDLIVMDYLQLMTAEGKKNNRVEEVSHISRQLKILAREIDVPVLTAAQLSRAVEQRASKRPVLSDLRESGSIEQDADIVMFVFTPDEITNERELIVAKHRSGPTGSVDLVWMPNTTTFKDATKRKVSFGV
ncbi:MAG: replicative DNA helicase [Anaerolineae bacterium]|jgi:replicative DNA helicase|nr:replicative DNA helicase [Anaerolineae bacterium]